MAFAEVFFILTPQSQDGRPVASNLGGYGLYHDAQGTLLLWSAPFPVPAINARVWVNMNRIGWAKVVGYFTSGDPDKETYLGLMVKPSRPPEYYRRQTRENKQRANAPQWMKDGIGCVFGAEILERRPQ